MALKENRAEITWEGNLMEGQGRLKVDSGAFPELTLTFAARTEGREKQTNPEELIAAAHATCYAMVLANMLNQNGTAATRLNVAARSTLDRVEGGLKITAMQLTVRGNVPNLNAADFERIAAEGEQKCPVSNALRGNVEITVDASLA